VADIGGKIRRIQQEEDSEGRIISRGGKAQFKRMKIGCGVPNGTKLRRNKVAPDSPER